MKEYEVWSEGYAATGESSSASYHGTWKGETFRDAVAAFRDSITDEDTRRCIDLNRMTFWGCRFFDNRDEAEALYG